MEKRFCGKCGSPLDEKTGLCPNCDVKRKSNSNNKIIIFLVVLIIALIISAIIYATQSGIFSKHGNEDTSYSLMTSQSAKYEEQSAQETTEAEISNTTETTEEITTFITTETTEILPSQSEYLFPSDTELLTKSFLDTKSKNEIDLIRNEIYARHGYIFKMEQYYDYFIKKSWYNPTEPDMEKAYEKFNSIEKQNIEVLVEYQDLG